MPSVAMISALPQLHGCAAPPRFYNKPKFLLAPDPKYAPAVLCTELGQHVHFMTRPPLSALSNQQFTVNAHVDGKWSRVSRDVPTIPSRSNTRHPSDGDLPLPPTLDDILRMEPELSPRSVLQRASDVPASVAQAFLRGLKNSHGKVNNPRKRKVHTPFPPHHDDQSGSTGLLDGATNASRKRTKKGTLPDAASTAADTSKFLEFQHEFQPLVEWLTVVLYSTIVLPQGVKRCPIGKNTKKMVVSRILNILWAYTPESTLVMSAVWYIRRLFPGGIVAAELFVGLDAVESMVRIFVLGFLLAWKWLHDAVIKAKCWETFVSLTCESINKLEKAALKVLDYNICISPGQWESWLISLQESARCFTHVRSGGKPAYIVINDLLSLAQRVHGVYVPEPIAPPTTFSLEHELHSIVMAGLFDGRLSFERHPNTNIPEPAGWNPAADAMITLSGSSLKKSLTLC